MSKYFLIIFTVLHLTAFSQVDPKIWKNLKSIKSEYYEIQVPDNWREIPTNGDPKQFFEASGLILPVTYKGWPVIVTIFLAKEECKDLENCKDKCLSGYRSNADRVFEENFKDGAEKIKLSNGQSAYFLNTRFFRKSKDLNQSRFDLVVFSGKAHAGYLYTVSVQYKDPDYKFETENELPAFAKKLFSYFKLKD